MEDTTFGGTKPQNTSPKSEQPSITPQKLELPKGGGAIRGISESFQANSFTGSGSFSIPIPIPSCRNFSPTLSVDYSSGSGNGVFGIGFNISIASIIRKTSKKVPTYNDEDIFVLTGVDDLVPTYQSSNNEYDITYYQPRVEGLFAKIERLKSKGNGSIHWQVTSKDGTTAVYGKNKQAQIYDSSNVAEWLLEELSDVYGNKIIYHYRSSQADANKQGDGKVIDSITYGYNKELNYNHFEVLFDYSENDFANPIDRKYGDTREAILRLDPFTSHITGFAIRTELLCRAIRIYHRFDELSREPILVNGTYFDYDEKPTITYLRAVNQIGYYERENKRFTKATPTLVLSYTSEDFTYISTVSSVTLKDGNKPSKELLQILKEQDFTFSEKDSEITKENSAWKVVEKEKTLLVKEKGNFLDLHKPNNKNSFKSVKIKGSGSFPGYLSEQKFQSVDLYQEGIEGILYNDGNTILYFRPNGNGEFSHAKLLEKFPLLLCKPTYSLLSLEGNGALQLYVNENSFQGYHDFDGDSKWSEFKPLESQVINLSSELQEMIDVTGDGRTDIIVFEGESVRVYPSAGKKGFKEAIYSKAPKDLPNQRFNSESTLVRFADMFGDGKSHLVKIENGKVECWPNLGYGKFGEKVTFKNAPYFRDGFNAKRLYFADIDGSGTTDLVYAHHNSLDIYYNNSGNAFSKPVNLKLPVDYNHISRIELADILGNGTNCLLISYLDQNLKLQHLYYDFYDGVKPHLLKQIDNNMGNLTRLYYAASTKFYLEDRKENHPWITSLPFPVQVIERIEVIDNIVGSRLTNKYSYHHGFYDYTEKEFRGFGFVETWDTEDFSTISQIEKEHYVAPIYTKTWHHTGAYKKAEDLIKSYRKEFYQGDTKALKITPQVFDKNITSVEDKRQAYRAIQGQMLRQEVYGLDKEENPTLYQHPYSITESSAAVRLLRSGRDSTHKEFKYGIFFVNLQETISYHYERNCCDPRVQHDFILEVDKYGNVLKSASITYPRRNQPNNYPEQQKLHATLEHNFYINNTKKFYLLSTLYKSQSFEIGGIKVVVDGYTNINDLKAHIEKSLQNAIKFEENLSYISPQARLLSENHNYYWNEAQSVALPFGSVTQQALLHHTEAMAFSDSQIKEVFARKITSDQMLKDLGYKKSTSGFWWALSPTQYYYSSDKYYLPKKVIDAFGAETAVVYNKCNLLPIKTIVKATANSNYETTAEYDYQRLMPVKLIDNNDNISEVILNPLGVVIATSIYGREKGQAKGDKPLLEYRVRKDPSFEDILKITTKTNGPEHYLQNATSFFYYDLDAWRNSGQPVHVINLQRETHASEDSVTRIRRIITHIDGFGRNLETKMLTNVETGEWLASGRVVYNNKGKEVKKYEPFYSDTPYYNSEEAVHNQGVSETLYYDPLLRNFRIDTPKGFFSKIEFDSWSSKNFDLNDTVKDSTYYKEFTEKWNKASTAEKVTLRDEKDALDKAEKHYNTPTIEHLDSLGRKFLQIEILSKDDKNNVELKSHVKLDIQGNELESVDPRFYEQNKGKTENEQIKNFRHIYSMSGLFKSISVDAGESWNLANVVGSAVYGWDSKGSLTYTEYDRLQRPVKVKVTDKELNLHNNVVERFFYSENTQDKATNRYGMLIAHYDQAGLTRIEENDFKSQTLKSSYILRKNYKQEADWKDVDSITVTHADLEREIFNSSIKYNALGEVIEKTDPQNNTHIPIYDIAGRVKQIKLKKSVDPVKTYVENISYNPKGQRISITYGNGVITSYSYDPKTFRLIKLESTKGQKKLQSINYTYDPVGNITCMNDDSYKVIFPNNKNIDTNSDYHYDSLYRLIQATGKEHPALSGKEEIITLIPHLNNQNAINNYTEYYDFDYGGNITKIRHAGVHGSTKEFYISNKSNRSLPITDNRSISENDIGLSYDERGNLLKLNGLQDLHWNYRDNIAHVDIITRSSGKNDSEYYVYDSSGQRVRKITETYQEANHTKIDRVYFGDIEVTRTYRSNDQLLKEKHTIHIADDQNKVALHHYWTKGTTEETRESQDRYQLSLMGIRAYLKKYNLSLADIYQELVSTSDNTSAESLGLSPEEYKLIASSQTGELKLKELCGIPNDKPLNELKNVDQLNDYMSICYDRLQLILNKYEEEVTVSSSDIKVLLDAIGNDRLQLLLDIYSNASSDLDKLKLLLSDIEQSKLRLFLEDYSRETGVNYSELKLLLGSYIKGSGIDNNALGKLIEDHNQDEENSDQKKDEKISLKQLLDTYENFKDWVLKSLLDSRKKDEKDHYELELLIKIYRRATSAVHSKLHKLLNNYKKGNGVTCDRLRLLINDIDNKKLKFISDFCKDKSYGALKDDANQDLKSIFDKFKEFTINSLFNAYNKVKGLTNDKKLSISEKEIKNLSNESLCFLHRFIRLANKLDWSYSDLAQTLVIAGKQDIDEDVIKKIAQIKRLAERFEHKKQLLNEILGFYSVDVPDNAYDVITNSSNTDQLASEVKQFKKLLSLILQAYPDKEKFYRLLSDLDTSEDEIGEDILSSEDIRVITSQNVAEDHLQEAYKIDSWEQTKDISKFAENSGIEVNKLKSLANVYNDINGLEQISSMNRKVSRTNIATAIVDNEAIFFGGFENNKSSNKVDVYNITTEKWEENEPLSNKIDTCTGKWKRYTHEARQNASVAIVDSKAIFFGGRVGVSGTSDKVDIYDSESKKWESNTGSISEARENAAVAVVHNNSGMANKAVFFGGRKENNTYSAKIDIYDATNGKWEEDLPNASEARENVAVAVVGDKAIFFGGKKGQNQYLPKVDVYDDKSRKWKSFDIEVPFGEVEVVIEGNKANFVGRDSSNSIHRYIIGYPIVVEQFIENVNTFTKVGLEGKDIKDIIKHGNIFGIERPWSISIDQMQVLLKYKRLEKKFASSTPNFSEYIEWLYSSKYGHTKIVEEISKLTKWNKETLKIIQSDKDFETCFRNDNNPIDSLLRIESIINMINESGIDVDLLLRLKNLHNINLVDDTDNKYEKVATTLRSSIALEEEDKIIADLEEKKRDILVGFIISKYKGSNEITIKNTRDLYNFLLVDVEMSSCAKISPLKAALNSMQLYIHRCILGLEEGVTVNQDPEKGLSEEMWNLLDNYREWEAAKKITLYPENYLNPTLRKSATAEYKALQNTLMQGDITDEAVVQAYVRYFEDFAQLVNLQIVDTYFADNRLYILGRTQAEPYTYYYRVADFKDNQAQNWLPWEKIDIQIPVSIARIIHAFGKVFVFWLQKTEKEKVVDFIGEAYRKTYTEGPKAILMSEKQKQDFKFNGFYGIYLWEIFFHIPTLAAYLFNQEQKFAEARKWYQYILNPTKKGCDAWQFIPFKIKYNNKDSDEKCSSEKLISFPDPYKEADSKRISFEKYVIISYVDNLIDWGDMLFSQNSQNSWEEISQATILYIRAWDLLGSKPERKEKSSDEVKNICELSGNKYNVCKIEGVVPVNAKTNTRNGFAAAEKALDITTYCNYFCTPENKDFVGLWGRIEDRLYKIRHCLDIKGKHLELPLFQPPIDLRQLISAIGSGAVRISQITKVPHYRFKYMISYAKSIADNVIQIGSELLNVLEKRDTEALTLLYNKQEGIMANLITVIKEKAIEALKEEAKALNVSLSSANDRRSHYEKLINDDLSSLEREAKELFEDAHATRIITTAIRGIAAGTHLIPTVFGFACGGFQPGSAAEIAAIIFESQAMQAEGAANEIGTYASYKRREEDWDLQKIMATHDVEQTEHQISANKVSQANAEQDLKAHKESIKQIKEKEEFFRSKFTNQELYNWMKGELARLYFQTYKLALEIAKQAELAYRYEIDNDRTFVQQGHWNSLKQGLLAGQKLKFDLEQMDKEYHDANERRLEITKIISLKQLDPIALYELKTKGSCRFSFTEKLFDLDFPGHYARKIKDIKITIPAVVGPYENIHASLQQTSNQVILKNDGAINAIKYLLNPSEEEQPENSLLRVNWKQNQEIAISRADQDSGLFELSFGDDRYLPFEGTGAVSSWELNLPQATNRFDVSTISDVIIHLDYTALNGGKFLSDKVKNLEQLKYYYGNLAINLSLLYPEEWNKFKQEKHSQLAFKPSVEIFPAYTKKPEIDLEKSHIYIIPKTLEDLTKVRADINGHKVSLNELGKVRINNNSSLDIGSDWKLNINNLDINKLEEVIVIIPYKAEINWK